MSPRSRAQDLTADLLHDLEAAEIDEDTADAEDANEFVATAPTRPAPRPVVAAPFVQATLFPAPRSWRRPGLSRRDGALTVTAGPLQLRVATG